MRLHHRLPHALVAALLLALASALAAQTGGAKPEDRLHALFAAHKGDFDYLLGDWQFDGVSKQFGKFHGYWSAVRLAGEGEILDEYRIVGDSGQTYYVTSTLRAYDALRDRWELVSLGDPNGLQDIGTGTRVGNEMHIEQSFGVGGPNPSILRIRYYDIGADHFSWAADRSTDGGRSWTPDDLRLAVRRIGPPHAITPLAAPNKAAPGAGR